MFRFTSIFAGQFAAYVCLLMRTYIALFFRKNHPCHWRNLMRILPRAIKRKGGNEQCVK